MLPGGRVVDVVEDPPADVVVDPAKVVDVATLVEEVVVAGAVVVVVACAAVVGTTAGGAEVVVAGTIA